MSISRPDKSINPQHQLHHVTLVSLKYAMSQICKAVEVAVIAHRLRSA